MKDSDASIFCRLIDTLYLLGVILDVQYDEDVELLETSGSVEHCTVPNLKDNRLRSAKDFWSTCRETNKFLIQGAFNFVKRAGAKDKDYAGYHMLKNIKLPGDCVHVLPNFENGSSTLMVARKMARTAAENMPLFTDLVNKLACMMLSLPYGDRAFDISFRYEKSYPVPSNTYDKEHESLPVFMIDFPNLFLSSPSVFSIWTSLVRKAYVVMENIAVNAHISEGEKVRALQVINSIKYYDDAEKIINVMSTNEGDPFSTDRIDDYNLIRWFPIRFYEFSAKTRDKDLPNIFDPETWYSEIGARGHLDVCCSFWNTECVKKSFSEYLESIEKYDKDIKEGLEDYRRYRKANGV